MPLQQHQFRPSQPYTNHLIPHDQLENLHEESIFCFCYPQKKGHLYLHQKHRTIDTISGVPSYKFLSGYAYIYQP